MQLALDELYKSLRYHQRQLEDNLSKIEINLQSNELLKEKSLIHEQTIEELNRVIERVKDSEGNQVQSVERKKNV